MSKPKIKFNLNREDNLENVRELGKRKKFTQHDINSFHAKGEKQKEFLKLCFQQVPVVISHGCAGTGKTFLAMYAALTEVFDPSTPYDRVIIVRSVVEVRKMGFLPGSEEEKQEVYEAPYREIMKEIVRYNDPYTTAKALGCVEFQTTSFLRGKTFNDAIVIVDEVQNMDYAECATIFTRIGENSKVIFIGDDVQSDLPRYRQESGFKRLRDVVSKMPSDMVGMVSFGFDDIVRSDIVKQFIIAESKTP